MGTPSRPFLDALHLLGNEGRCNSGGPLPLCRCSGRRWRGRKQRVTVIKKGGHINRILKKRRARFEGSRRPTRNNVVEKKVRTLRRLVPNSDQPVGLDGLFREAADYIMSLQMRVKVMQVMVNVLSGGSDE